MEFTISDSIFEDHPDLVLGLVVCHNIDNSTEIPDITALLRGAEAGLSSRIGSAPLVEHPHIVPWREAYRRFGAKPKNYPSSVENLTRRVLQGATFPYINSLVSLYNAISLKYILPAGGEDLDKIEGDVFLTKAGDAEPAVLLLGEQEARPPHAGEIFYKDAVSAICRRWNWKEADRTKLSKGTRNAVLVIETLPPVPREALQTAIDELAASVEKYCGGAIRTELLDSARRSVSLS